MHKTLGLRAHRDVELSGIDEHEHGETAYNHGRFGQGHATLPHLHAHTGPSRADPVP